MGYPFDQFGSAAPVLTLAEQCEKLDLCSTAQITKTSVCHQHCFSPWDKAQHRTQHWVAVLNTVFEDQLPKAASQSGTACSEHPLEKKRAFKYLRRERQLHNEKGRKKKRLNSCDSQWKLQINGKSVIFSILLYWCFFLLFKLRVDSTDSLRDYLSSWNNALFHSENTTIYHIFYL